MQTNIPKYHQGANPRLNWQRCRYSFFFFFLSISPHLKLLKMSSQPSPKQPFQRCIIVIYFSKGALIHTLSACFTKTWNHSVLFFTVIQLVYLLLEKRTFSSHYLNFLNMSTGKSIPPFLPNLKIIHEV